MLWNVALDFTRFVKPRTEKSPLQSQMPLAKVALNSRTSDDLALARQCAEGDRSAQRELFDRESGRVHRALYRILGSNAHIDDLFQEVFVAVFRSIGQFRGDAPLGAWIDRTAVRTAFAYLKARRKRGPMFELVDVAAADPSAEHRVMLREAVRHLYAELDRLDPKLRIAFTLHVIDERPIEEVARMMDATKVATKTRIFRARRAVEKRARRDGLLAQFVASGGEPEGSDST